MVLLKIKKQKMKNVMEKKVYHCFTIRPFVLAF